MSLNIKVPMLPESVVDATVAAWHKQPGEKVNRDETIVDIETDKVVLEVVAPADGTIASVLKKEGETVVANEVIGLFDDSSGKAAEPVKATPQPQPAQQPAQSAQQAVQPAQKQAKPVQQPAQQSAQLTQQAKPVAAQDQAQPAKPMQTAAAATPATPTSATAVAATTTATKAAAVSPKPPVTAPAPAQTPATTQAQTVAPASTAIASTAVSQIKFASPAIRRALAQRNIDPAEIKGTGKDGRITKEDVIAYINSKKQQAQQQKQQQKQPAQQQSEQPQRQPQQLGRAAQAIAQRPAAVQQPQQRAASATAPQARPMQQPAKQPASAVTAATATPSARAEAKVSEAATIDMTLVAAGSREERRVPMTRLRARIAERLLQAQNNAAILTTFNEVNMQPIVELRNQYKEKFAQTHGVRLGFMSFFVLAAVEALKRFPAVNASIDGNDIVYHGYYDIGIAVASPRGLVVPIIRNAESLGFAEIEKKIIELSEKANTGKLTIEEITGGTFTISNGGVFGSLMSTPILNPPQSGILGMHKIEQRPIVEDNKIAIRPMMYLALSYDHRIIDGAESVRFLLTIKEMLEDPARLLLHV